MKKLKLICFVAWMIAILVSQQLFLHYVLYHIHNQWIYWILWIFTCAICGFILGQCLYETNEFIDKITQNRKSILLIVKSNESMLEVIKEMVVQIEALKIKVNTK